MEIIEPKILQGTRDFLPKEMAKRNLIMGKIVSTFTKFGYDAIETPSIEYSETILGKYGEEGSKLVYRFKDNGKRDICLRYDQTVPFARVVAMNYKNLPMPFKRYQIGKVWRADKPAKGRYREFYQCDIDIIGTRSLVAEAEIAKVITDVFKNLDFPKIVIKFNSRRLINSILTGLNIQPAKQSDVIRILDKLEKLSLEKIKQELKPIISSSTTEKLFALLKLGGNLEEKLALLNDYNTEEITDFIRICKSFGVPSESLMFEPSLARGLDYYTGIIYEVYIPDLDIGAVCAGGRYDDLCSMFSPEKFSGVGVAFGFDRIVLAMESLKLLDSVGLNSQVLVTYFDESTLESSLRILKDVQTSGVSAEIYFEPARLDKQLKYADKKNIPFVIICGPEEEKQNEVAIKIMKSGKQKKIPRNQVISYFKSYKTI